LISTVYNRSLHWFLLATAFCTLCLLVVGGLVTSHGVGMSVPDWPTSYGYNMFALPVSLWLTGGVFHEHTHRLWATLVGVLIVALTRWIGGHASRRPLAIIGACEVVAGQLLLLLGKDWRGAGHFLSGIGGVVLLAAMVWVRNSPSARPLPGLAWLAFWLVQLQGLLGGLRVVLDAHLFAGTRLGVWFGVFHGCLAQVFLVLVAVMALLTSRGWIRGEMKEGFSIRSGPPRWHFALLFTTGLILVQLLIGATMRHQHAGLAIPDFPLAYGRVWPDLSPEAVARYNQQRIEMVAQNAITSTQIMLQMAHRIVALTIVCLVIWCAVVVRKALPPGHELRRLAGFWVMLIAIQFGLGAWTIWSNKAADVASMHVVCGALSLVTGGLMCVISARLREGVVMAPAENQTQMNPPLMGHEAGAAVE
jgi:cytochrome c oxidase assembly protein subunit 15